MKQWEDIYEIGLPLPFALKEIKVYLIKGSTGYTIIDAGLHTDDSISTWKRAQEVYHWNWDEVEKIVLTHYHPDHYGLAGSIQQWTQAPVYISQTDQEQAKLFLDPESDMPELMSSFFRKHGLAESLVAEIPNHLRSFHSWVEPHPTSTFIQGGDSIQLGDRTYQIFHTPGHADGHLSFFDPERGWLIGGDFLLPRITPNISLWPGCNDNPLETYLLTLEKMKELPVQRVFPSHGSVFDHYHERIDQIREHHEIRLGKMKEMVEQSDGLTAFDVCQKLFGTELSIHNLRFALSETLAHLEYLKSKDAINVVGSELIRYVGR
ncbi:MBL fold metallo-hydrolase [Hazenella coriacea]|uniref:Glyoxylase-like metal-dependent hydrolase (Beta-lactamase superfamily II) n=1 Tax=Hazenella coriacea TaxID=1179467 RepID=A0A4R3LAY6_9BACL|nr:MBL fold metallo-hydrolase [Hazenella coriacea]TCS96919.1 glyoxylase-like metal-dependent hydrolase (beta-lactamase superfamily II) [Hazenella coriacea]